MSTQTTTIGAHGAFETAGRTRAKGFWHRLFDRMVAARQAQADRAIAAYIKGLSDQERKDLGFPTIADMR